MVCFLPGLCLAFLAWLMYSWEWSFSHLEVMRAQHM